MEDLSPEPEIDPLVSHNHITRDIKERGRCPACDRYWAGVDRRAAETKVSVTWEPAPTEIERATGAPTEGLQLTIISNSHETQLRNKGEIMKALRFILTGYELEERDG